ncbi:MAG: primosomal protein N' [Rhodospirillaceae bacterium]|nr:primosomal protein N' [Rhodospirillaceae bacterium]MBT5566989.1 primosomal protein N' [Rhodospirillaceae bacterium]
MIQSSAPSGPNPVPTDIPVSFGPGDRVAVLLPLPVEGAYDYRVPEDVSLAVGDLVEVPLGRRFDIGVVWGPGDGDIDPAKLKDVAHRLDLPHLPRALLSFIDWVADYTIQPKGVVLRMALRSSRGIKPQVPETHLVQAKGLPAGFKLTDARRKVLTALGDQTFVGAALLAKAAGVSTSVVKGLVDAGAINAVLAPPPPLFSPPDPNHPGLTLEPDQRAAADDLAAAVGHGFSVSLLEGVTGSGKTEVYFEPVAAALKMKRQVLVLVPEISLTTQWLDRFRARFGVDPAVWHSDVTGKVRRETWRAVATGDASVVVGARSALFLPFTDLGLIVVDEEHDVGFKQEEGVIYHARDMAVVRAREGDIPIILASATPSLESLLNAQSERYRHVRLEERVGGAVMPEVDLINMVRTPPQKGEWGRSWLAPPLVEAVTETLAAGEQTLLFLNRRGYAPLTLCSTCGHRLHCPSCTAWLVEHRVAKRLQCHHCGFVAPRPEACPSCSKADSFVPCGPGIERVAEEAAARWPEARVVAVASDTLERPSAMAALVEAVERHQIDIIVGTQVLAKGHHFPGLTLVGVVDADLGLSSWDLRAGERTHQLLNQVSGRAGRASKPGRVFLQTHDPKHPVLQALKTADADAFLEAETDGRRSLGMPPFGRLVALILSGMREDAVRQAGQQLARAVPAAADIEVLGPAPAFMALLRGRHRHRFLIKGPRNRLLQPFVRAWLGSVKLPSSVRIQVDVDPYSFY